MKIPRAGGITITTHIILKEYTDIDRDIVEKNFKAKKIVVDRICHKE